MRDALGVAADAAQFAPGRRQIAAPDQAVEPRPIDIGCQDVAMVLDDRQFLVGLEAVFDPGLADQGAARIALAGRDQRGAEAHLADAGGRGSPGEPGNDRRGGHGRGHGMLGAGEQNMPQRPFGIVAQEAADLVERRPAILVGEVAPDDDAPGNRIAALVGQSLGGDPVAAVAGIEGFLIKIVIGRAQRVDQAGPPVRRGQGRGFALAVVGAAAGHRLHHHGSARLAEPGRQGTRRRLGRRLRVGCGCARKERGRGKQGGATGNHRVWNLCFVRPIGARTCDTSAAPWPWP